ncbi:response regulator [Oscillatoria sp. CS-180]|uniref:response regulator n=1 Tax=Oscillatoria sp. CS-180 TaxID=3021720 RepID=UPI00232F9A68|nr:response regulator [Oscillatoria sp. CS-180]MDB9528658.1 response regulator [Oscillatoria sp. CS-180]
MSSSLELLKMLNLPAVDGESSGSRAATADADLPVVVVADDDVDNLVLLSYILEPFPCSLFCETDGKVALERALNLKPDLMMLDVRLPGISGLDIVRTLRADEATALIPIIAVTAMASLSDKLSIFQSGFNQYVSKPYLLRDIEKLIGLYLPVRV